MITDKLTIYGEKDDVLSICDLLTLCTKETELSPAHMDVYLNSNSKEPIAEGKDKILIIPFEMMGDIPKGMRCITYSSNDNSADVSSVNVQERSSALCFEILCGDFMNRVFIPYSAEYTQYQVLVCASVLYGFGVPMQKVVSLINESLK